jgi:transposase
MVERVALDVPGGRVDVWARHDKKARFACPECGKECRLYDRDEERVWRHLDTNAASEAINAGIQLLSSGACGFRSFAYFRVAILFRHGGLDLYPAWNHQVLPT